MKRLHTFLLSLILGLLISEALGNVMVPFYRKKANDASLSPVERLAAYDSLLHYTKSPVQRRKLLYDKGMFCFDVGKLHAATATYDELRKDMADCPTSEKCRILYGVIRTHIFNNDFHTSMRAIRELRQLEKEDSLRYYDALCYLTEGVIYTKFLRNDVAKGKVEAGFKSLADNKDKIPKSVADDVRANLFILKSIYFDDLRDYDKSLHALDSAELYGRSPDMKLLVNLNRGVLYSTLNKYDIAEFYFRNILEKSPLTHYNTGLAVIDYMSVLCSQGRYDDALDTYRKYARYLELIKNSPDERHVYGNLSLIYAAKQDWHQAYDMLNRYVGLTDSISYEQNRLLAHSFEAESLQNAKAEKHRKTVFRLSVGSLAFLVLALAGVAFYLWRRLRRYRAKDKAERRLADASDDNAADDKDLELTSLALQISRYTDTIQSMQSDIDNPALDKDAKLDAIRNSLRDVKMQNGAWEMFDKYFASTHRRFLSRLCTAHPNLTPGEVRMCAFVVLNLSTKEIADLTKRSARTIETTKYRIGKKLELDRPLHVYLHSFL